MLQSIRDKVSGWVPKVLFLSLVVVFVFWGIELRSVTSAPDSAAEVNGDSIKLSTVKNAWQQRRSELQEQIKGEIPEAQQKQEQDELMNQLVRTKLLQQRTESLGFRASDKDVAQEIRSLEPLQVDGKFSRERYATALLQRGLNEAQFESDVRSELEARHLQNGIVGTAFMTAKELARAQALLDEKRDIDYVILPAKAYISGVKVNDNDVTAWYEKHKNEYLTTESVKLQYVELNMADSATEVSVDEAALREHYEKIKDRYSVAERRRARHILFAINKDIDDAAAKKQADEVLAKLKAGGDFDALAKQYSKDPGSASKGGDLGWAGRGQYVKPFEDALFALKPGELSAPVKSEFGYHIIRLEEVEGGTSKTFDQVRAEVESDYKNDRVRSVFYEKTQKLADAAFAKLTELDSVAKEFNTTVKTVSEFTRQGGGVFGNDSQVIDAAFSESVLEKGENSPLVTLGEDRALVLRVSDHVMPAQKPLEAVRADVVAKLTDQLAKSAAEKQGQEVLTQLNAGSLTWTAINKRLPVAPVGKKTLGRSATIEQPVILKTAFAISRTDVVAGKSAYRSVVLSNGDYALIAVSSVQSGSVGSDEAIKSRIAELRTTQAQKVGTNDLSGYLQELRRNSKIKISTTAFQ